MNFLQKASLGLLLLMGCEATPMSSVDGGMPPPPPPPPTTKAPDRVGDATEAFVKALDSTPAHLAHPLPGDRVLAADAQGVRLVSTATSVAVSELLLTSATAFDEGVVAATEDSLYVLQDQALVLSPLSMALEGGQPTQLLGIRQDLWISTTQALHLWRGGEIYEIEPEGLPTRNARMAWSPSGDVWVASENAFYRLESRMLLEGGAQAFPQAVGGPIDTFGVDGQGTVWVVIGGLLYSRAIGGDWCEHDAVRSVMSVQTNGRSNLIWITTPSGFWQHEQGLFRPVQGVPEGDVLAVAEDGSALISGSGGLSQVFSELQVDLVGLEEGALLGLATTIEVRPLLPEQVEQVTATLDGAELSVSAQPWSVALDPALLADGSHELAVNVAYMGGTVVSESLRFSVYVGPPPSWEANIGPLFDDSCALCHGPQGSARRIDTPALWVELIDLILDNVRNDRMPLPPVDLLDASQVELIEGWQAAGFPER